MVSSAVWGKAPTARKNTASDALHSRSEVFSYFLSLRQKYSDDEIYELFDNDNYQIQLMNMESIQTQNISLKKKIIEY